MRKFSVLISCLWLTACAVAPQRADDTVWLSVIGTNDVHGELLGERGGLTNFSGYVEALREARALDGGVLLLDAGDMWQGTLESNLSEGDAVVRAYNALRYDAAAIGNHEFDFGPEGPAPIPVTPADDPRGALKARATQAAFPLLAANLIDLADGEPVDWDNVQPSVMIERSGVRIGIIGVTTAATLSKTIVPNTVGLTIAPLTETIQSHARALRERGADLVIVAAHAGGYCKQFDEPTDLSSCEADAEIFRVARELPVGLVDQIVAGHRHLPLAHVVNGIAITSNIGSARAFGRVDYRVDRTTRRVTQRIVFPPQYVCARVIDGDSRCATNDDPLARVARYEGAAIQPLDAVVAIAEQAAAIANTIKNEPLGVSIETPITRANPPGSALGRLMTDAMREATGTDVAIHNVVGGIRGDIPTGQLTYGDVYRVFPFDNRIAILEVPAEQLKTLLAAQVPNVKRRAGVSGLHVTVRCAAGKMEMDLTRPDGRPVADGEILRVVANDFLLLGGDNIFTPVTPAGGFELDTTQPLVRDIWVDWFRARGGSLRAEDYSVDSERRWHLPDPLVSDCVWSPGHNDQS